MKHTFQKIAIIMAVCFTALFTGCQKDDSPGTEQFTNSNTTITKISFEEFKKHPKAFSEFEELQGSKDGLRPKSREYGDGYYYETEEVTLIEYSDERYSYKSYIFPMYRDIPTNSIENLLIWEKSTGETNSYILTYYLSESDIESILTGKPIYLGNKTQIVPVQKSVPDPYVVQSAEGKCGVYSGLEPDYGDYFTMNVEGTTVYFDVVDCNQYVIDFSLMQGSNNGGSNGGGGSSAGGDDGWSVGVVYFPLIPGSGDGGGPVTDPDGPGGYYTYNPVVHTPVINVMYQQFYHGSLDSNQRMFLLANKDIRDRITQLVTVLSGYTEGPYALAEIIIDFAMAGYEEEALKLLDYLNNGNLNLNSNEVRELVEEMIDSTLNGTAISLKPFFKYPQGSNYATQYPKLTEYLKNKIPQLRFNQFIMDKLEQYSELSVEQIKNDLQYGKGPEIHIAQLNSHGQNVYGIFDHNTPDILYVDVDFVNILENSQPGPQGNALAFLLGVTILHEYVHLGDFVAMISQEKKVFYLKKPLMANQYGLTMLKEF